jgi:hypothetical protein
MGALIGGGTPESAGVRCSSKWRPDPAGVSSSIASPEDRSTIDVLFEDRLNGDENVTTRESFIISDLDLFDRGENGRLELADEANAGEDLSLGDIDVVLASESGVSNKRL